ncbi:gibberellin 2-beta-dioxygenase 2-like [Rutidosis leptorrhynchoides]|uniref:gibberellin 2-beta-dioxygenase 2-like n=1 Tax=Rutidosis leptorrhynchoides TaxID=125765 RepID=UPI003A99D9F9
MVVLPPSSMRAKKTSKAVGIPMIDLSLERSKLAELIVEACEEVGFFKVINHSVNEEVISNLENEGLYFFSKTTTEKQSAGPASGKPFGYECKNIGSNGDMGELEYLLLHANPSSVSEMSNSISPTEFSCCVDNYTEASREWTCEGLCTRDKSVLSKFIRDIHNVSVLRLNYYPPLTKLRDRVGVDCLRELETLEELNNIA